ncbi:hypothetical protein [Nocardia altamirensis]|uniref:hypothetical protein n=1 Tax=Nocardia altamirensis TaxID=472158 RepID=UPI0008403199|nr:hypothetical protein [Nocardia altamirensis]
MRRRIFAALAIVAMALSLTVACSRSTTTRWCEFDATDTVVEDSFCLNNTPGYEWEPDSDKPAKKPKTSTKPKPTTAKPAPTTRR